MINVTDEVEVGRSESSGNETNLWNLSMWKKSTGADYLTFEDTKKSGNNPTKGGNNTKKGSKATKNSDYLTSDTKKAFNHLPNAFT